MKVSELTAAELALWVCRAEGIEEERGIKLYADSYNVCLYKETQWGGGEPFHYRPDSDWSAAGPIIDRERISVVREWSATHWQAMKNAELGHHARADFCAYGHTPLEAAMRCYVASKFGEEV